MNKIKYIEEKHLKKDVPKFNIGDTVQVHVKIKEEGKVRIQVFEGIVIRRKGTSTGATFTVRRISYGEGVERVFLSSSIRINWTNGSNRISSRREPEISLMLINDGENSDSSSHPRKGFLGCVMSCCIRSPMPLCASCHWNAATRQPVSASEYIPRLQEIPNLVWRAS